MELHPCKLRESGSLWTAGEVGVVPLACRLKCAHGTRIDEVTYILRGMIGVRTKHDAERD